MNRLSGKNNKKKSNPISSENRSKQKRTYFNPYTTNSTNKTIVEDTSSYGVKTYKRKYKSSVNAASSKKISPPVQSNLSKKSKSMSRTLKNSSYTTNTSYGEKSNNGSNTNEYIGSRQNRYSNSYPISHNKKSKTSNNKMQKAKLRKRKQLISWIKVAGIVATTTLVILGSVGIVENMNRPKVIYQTVKEGSIDNSKKLEGIILRNEEVILENLKDNVKLLVTEGEKVKKDGQTYVIGDAIALENSIQIQEQIDKQIYDKAEEREDISYYQDDISNINKVMETDFNMFYDNINQSNTRFVYNLRSKLESSISNKTNIYTNEQNDKQNNIAKEKAEIEDAISKNNIIMTAPRSGIISYYIDGSETLYASEEVETIDYNRYNDFSKGLSVVEDSALYKIIFDNKWYIVTYTDKEYDDDFKEGQTYELWFDHNNKQVPFKLNTKTIESNKYLRLVFETSDQIGSFLDIRNVEFTIGDKNVQGIKIPKSAIVEQNMIKVPISYSVNKDSKYGVYRKNGEASEYVEIDVKYRKEDYLYIRQDITNKNVLQINDVIVEPVTANTYTLKEMKTEQGVYVANGNVAEFKTVTPIHLTTDYAIIDPEGMTQLKVGDRMITNPKSIEIDQLIKK